MEPGANVKYAPPSAKPQASRADSGYRVREWATRYWNEMKWCVVPAHVPITTREERRACTCGAGVRCDKPGKHPIGLWGEIEYATAKDRWREPGMRWLVNVSLLTGRRSGVVIADVDLRYGGTLKTLWELGWSPNTVASRTGGGGWHVFAQCPADGLPSVAAYAMGIEFRANLQMVGQASST